MHRARWYNGIRNSLPPTGRGIAHSKQTWRKFSTYKMYRLAILAHRSGPTAAVVPLDPSDLQPPHPRYKHRSAQGTATVPAYNTLKGIDRYLQLLWRLQDRLRAPEMQYAVKVGLGTGDPVFMRKPRKD